MQAFAQMQHQPKKAASSHHARGRTAGAIQTKLAINTPGDAYEQEADRVAAQVMRMPDPQLQRACPCGGGCPKCRAEQPERQRLQTKHVHAGDAGQSAAPPIVHEVLRSTGRPLDQPTRDFMEQHFAYDFSRVRVHSGGAAEQSAREVNAHAYTVGHDIVFGAGMFAPGTHAGRQLLAHELTHVVQQGSQQRTLMRACDCAAIGGRPPDPSVPLEAGVSGAFPGLVSGDWCVLKSPTPSYNCYAWSISNTTQWIDTQVDSVYGDKDGKLSFSDFDAYYQKTLGLNPQAAPNSNTVVALFAKGSDPQHAARVAGIESCGSIPFTSKLGPGPLIAHDLYQLEGTTYGKVGRYYG